MAFNAASCAGLAGTADAVLDDPHVEVALVGGRRTCSARTLRQPADQDQGAGVEPRSTMSSSVPMKPE